jgi:nucleotide-binding universal stress UspA family protein
VVVGIDGSDAGQRALRWAADEAIRRHAVLDVVHAWLPPYPVDPQDLFKDETHVEEHSRRFLADQVARLRADAPETGELRETLVMEHPAKALVAAADGAALLVVGSRGRGGFKGLRLGSVSRKCVQIAPCPVVVVPPRDLPDSAPVVVVGVDGSEHSRLALRWAAQEAVWWQARLDVVQAWTPPALFVAEGVPVSFDTDAYEDASERLLHDMDAELALAGQTLPERRLVPVADAPARALLEAAKQAALLVVGARGRGGFGGLLLGSVSQQCLQHAPCPVAVVRMDSG